MATSQSLKQFISLGIVIVPFLLYWTLLQECTADASWNNFALCQGCTGKRLIVPGNLFQPRLIGKGTSLIWVRMDCSHSCANQDSCHAFNFYENENFYVCELLSDNLRRNKAALQLTDHPGCSVWEKLSTGVDSLTTEISTKSTPGSSTTMTESSTVTNPEPSTAKTSASTAISSASTAISSASTAITSASTSITSASVPKSSPSTGTTSLSIKITAIPTTGTTLPTTDVTSQLCADVRWGCLGTHPNCHSCIKTCKDYMARDGLFGPPIYLWPDGDGLDSVPISGECYNNDTVLMERAIDLTSGTETTNNITSIYDMHRLIKLNAYKYLRFFFQTSFKPNVTYRPRNDNSDYSNVFMSPNGTLSNLTFHITSSSTVDIFNLNSQPMKPTPFVNVTDDRYGCGSFWLLDDTNATYCPGGATSLFGTFRTDGTQIVNTGIRVPGNLSGFTYYVQVSLTD